MGLIFLILFTLAEIALVVLTLTKFNEKVKWLKNRAIVRTAELALMLGIILVPATNMKWRFFIALAVLVIRFLIAGISWLVRRRKPLGAKNKAATVVNCVITVLLFPIVLTPAFIFSNYNGLPVTGEFTVKQSDAVLVDKSRVDTFENDGSCTEVPAHFY